MAKRTLYELTERYEALMDLACDEADDEGQLSQSFVAMLQALEGEITDKVENTCRVLRNIESVRDSVASEMERLKSRHRTLESRVADIKEHLRMFLQSTGKSKMQAGIFSLAIQPNGKPKVVLDNESLIPEEFYVTREPELSLSKVADAIESGVVVPGAHTERGCHLRVR